MSAGCELSSIAFYLGRELAEAREVMPSAFDFGDGRSIPGDELERLMTRLAPESGARGPEDVARALVEHALSVRQAEGEEAAQAYFARVVCELRDGPGTAPVPVVASPGRRPSALGA